MNYTCGMNRELEVSKEFHSHSKIPLLISPQLLRSMGCGQIDLARWENSQTIKILEVKGSKQEGEISAFQHSRLKKSANFLGELLESTVIIEFSFKS